MAIVNELITALGFELKQDSMATLQAYESALSDLGNKAKQTWKAITDAGETANKRSVLKRITGLSTQRQEQWRQVAAAAGADAEQFLGTIGRLYKLGATEGDIMKWADELKGASVRERMAIQQQLGISDEDVSVLLAGSKAIKEMFKAIDTEDPKTVEKAAQAWKHWNSITQSFSEAKDKLGQKTMSALEQPLAEGAEYLRGKQGQDILQTGIATSGVIGTAATLYKMPAFAEGFKNIISFAFKHGAKTAATSAVAEGTAATGTAAGGSAAAGGFSLGALASSFIITKTLWDVTDRFLKVLDQGMDKGFELKPINERSIWDWLDVSQYAIMTGKEIGDAFGDTYSGLFGVGGMFGPEMGMGSTINSNNNITIQVTTPAQAKDIIGEYTGMQPTTQGAYQPTITP